MMSSMKFILLLDSTVPLRNSSLPPFLITIQAIHNFDSSLLDIAIILTMSFCTSSCMEGEWQVQWMSLAQR